MRNDLSSAAVRSIFAAVILLYAHPARSRWIHILGEKYWERTLITEMNMSSPTAFVYGRRETLVNVDNQVLRYKSDDYSSYEIVKGGGERPPQILKDKEGNSLLTNNFYVFFLHKKDPPTQMLRCSIEWLNRINILKYELMVEDLESSSLYNDHSKRLALSSGTDIALQGAKDAKTNIKVIAEGNPYFFDVSVDIGSGTAYLIGAKNGRVGKVYAFSTFRPIFTKGKLLINPVYRLNDRFVAISVDQTTGDIALIEKDYKTGWRMVLLAADRGAFRPDAPDGVDVSVERWDAGLASTSQFRESFVAALSNITAEVASRCAERSDSRVAALSRENRVLRRENVMVRRKLEYLMKSSNLYFEIPERPSFLNLGSDDKLKMEFSTSVSKSAKKILDLLTVNKVMWLDEKECQADCQKRCVGGPEIDKNKKCGTLPRNSMDDSLPWIVTILSGSKVSSEEFYTVCYGTLIHPTVILTFGKNCSELTPSTAIAQAGRFHSSEERRTVLQERGIAKILPGSQLTDIGDLTALFILDEEFDEFNAGVACMPKNRDAGRQNDRCRALTKQYVEEGEATYSVKQFDFTRLKRCASTTIDLLPGSSDDYYCAGELEISSECKETASLIVFCPALEYPNNFVIEAVLVKKFLGRCGEIFLNAASGLPWILRTLGDHNITIES